MNSLKCLIFTSSATVGPPPSYDSVVDAETDEDEDESSVRLLQGQGDGAVGGPENAGKKYQLLFALTVFFLLYCSITLNCQILCPELVCFIF